MNKIIFANLDLLKNEVNGVDVSKDGKDFFSIANNICSSEDNLLVFVSMHNDLLREAKKAYKNQCLRFLFCLRSEVKKFVQTFRERNYQFVFISGKEQDFHIAVQAKALFIVPAWIPCDEKVKRYGILVDNPKQLYMFIKALNNQNYWFSKLEIEKNVTLFSLMDARYGFYAKTQEEGEMLKHFENLLKQNTNRNYYEILLYHFIAGMTSTALFDDIELFGMIPSSDCSLNEDMHKFMTQVRYIKGKRLPKNNMEYDNLLIRHSKKKRAHEAYTISKRRGLGASDEFRTICLNPEFKTKIEKLRKEKRFNVMIFDDYVTHGNTFNAVRNLLKAEGVNKLIFVALGSFNNPFIMKNYELSGSVYKDNYSVELISTDLLTDFEYRFDAKDEVAKLYRIFNLYEEKDC